MIRTASEVTHPKEIQRLAALRALQVLDTPIEARFERITRLACKAFDVPIAAISCIDLHRQWFKSIQGLEVVQTERCVSFCQHTILQDDVLVVPDARLDERFANNPLVTGEPHIAFYAGTQIRSRGQMPVATLCLIDTEVHDDFTQADRDALRAFGQLVERELHTPCTNPIEEALIHQVGESWRSMLTDPLTRVWNHEGITLLITESLRVCPPEHPLGAAIIALDNLDQFRAQHGPVRADALVREYARQAQLLLNEGDAIGRLRGGEFAIAFHTPESDEHMHEKLQSLTELGDQISGMDNAQRTHAHGIWFPGGGVEQPDRILEQLADGLQSIRTNPDRAVEVRAHCPASSKDKVA